jgi:hypothetical protein
MFSGLAAFILSAALGLGFALVINRTHDLFALPSFEEKAILGTWQGNWHDVPAVTITINRDGEELTGTVVFQLVLKTAEGPRAVGEPVRIPLQNAKFDGKTLRFRVDDQRTTRSLGERNVELTLTDTNQAELNVTAGCKYDGTYQSQELKMLRTAWPQVVKIQSISWYRKHMEAWSLTMPTACIKA